jgi:hypothetical protein
MSNAHGAFHQNFALWNVKTNQPHAEFPARRIEGGFKLCKLDPAPAAGRISRNSLARHAAHAISIRYCNYE